jgi:hypothetical protein
MAITFVAMAMTVITAVITAMEVVTLGAMEMAMVVTLVVSAMPSTTILTMALATVVTVEAMAMATSTITVVVTVRTTTIMARINRGSLVMVKFTMARGKTMLVARPEGKLGSGRTERCCPMPVQMTLGTSLEKNWCLLLRWSRMPVVFLMMLLCLLLDQNILQGKCYLNSFCIVHRFSLICLVMSFNRKFSVLVCSTFRDAANAQDAPRTKRFVPKVKLSGSQKRKQKKKGTVDGSKKNAEQAKEENAVHVSKERIATEPNTYFEEEKKVTLDEYEKVLEQRKKSMETTATVARMISAEEFEGLQLLEKKKADEEEAVKKAEKAKPAEETADTTQSKGDEGAAKKPKTKPDPKMVFQTWPF